MGSCETCSQCKMVGATFSKRQQAKPPGTWKCLNCMGTSGEDLAIALQVAEGVPVRKAADDNQAKQVICSEPCSLCGLTDAAYSRRQSKVPIRERQCLACRGEARDHHMIETQGELVRFEHACSVCCEYNKEYRQKEEIKPGENRKCVDCWKQSTVAPLVRDVTGALAKRSKAGGKKALAKGGKKGGNALANDVGKCGKAFANGKGGTFSGALLGKSDVPCFGCCRDDVFYSQRQMKLPMEERRCMECLALQQGEEPGVGLAVVSRLCEAGVSHGKARGHDPPVPTLCDEPCSACGVAGMAFSKRQLNIPVDRRKCLECMGPQGPNVPPPKDNLLAATRPVCKKSAGKGNKSAGKGKSAETSPVGFRPPPVSSEDPCSVCFSMCCLFSVRQMAKPAAERKCLECVEDGL